LDKSDLSKNEELLKSCSMGDERAWSFLIERFSPLVRWAIRSKISRSTLYVDENDISDIFQQTFAQIWRKNRLKDLRNPKAIASYLTIIAQNLAVDFLRSRKRLINLCITEDNLNLLAIDNPRDESQNKQLCKEVDLFIDALPLRERRIMTLELFYDLKHREISAVMGVPLNTVSTIIARIKDNLRKNLRSKGYGIR